MTSRGSASHLEMLYSSDLGYHDEGSSHSPEEDVLDLSLGKREREKCGEDVNGNAYLGVSDEFFGVCSRGREVLRIRSPGELAHLKEQECSPTMVVKERTFPDVPENLHRAVACSSPHSCPQFPAESITQRRLPTPRPLPVTTITTRNGKPTRPFKAYPKDFLALATSTEDLLDDSQKRFMEFRKQCLDQLHSAAGPANNKNMKRPLQSDSPNQLPSSSGDVRDQAYWERRKKNNEAAKKSRDARRAKEDELAIRAAFLEQENVQLKMAYASLRSKFDRLYSMMYATS